MLLSVSAGHGGFLRPARSVRLGAAGGTA